MKKFTKTSERVERSRGIGSDEMRFFGQNENWASDRQNVKKEMIKSKRERMNKIVRRRERENG